MKLLIIIAFISSCTTIKPRVTASNFYACASLCKTHGGASHISNVLDVDYRGGITIVGEECACKNNRTFSIIESQQ